MISTSLSSKIFRTYLSVAVVAAIAFTGQIAMAGEFTGTVISADPQSDSFTILARGIPQGPEHVERISVDDSSVFEFSSGESICSTCDYRFAGRWGRRDFLARLRGRQIRGFTTCDGPGCRPRNLLINAYLFDTSLNALNLSPAIDPGASREPVEAVFGKVTWRAPNLDHARLGACFCRELEKSATHRNCALEGEANGGFYLVATADVPARTNCSLSCERIFQNDFEACGKFLGNYARPR